MSARNAGKSCEKRNYALCSELAVYSSAVCLSVHCSNLSRCLQATRMEEATGGTTCSQQLGLHTGFNNKSQ